MAADALVQARVDHDIKERAAMVLQDIGLTTSDAVRILLTQTANEGASPFALAQDPAAYDDQFRTKVQAALDDPRPGIRIPRLKHILRHAGRLRTVGLPSLIREAGMVLSRTR